MPVVWVFSESYAKINAHYSPITSGKETKMKNAVLTAVVLLGATAFSGTMVSAQNAKLSTAECQSIWNSAGPAGGDLTSDQAKRYVDDLKALDTNGNGRISSDEFYAACGKGLVHAASTAPARSDMAPKK
jgi:hypothetical protein